MPYGKISEKVENTMGYHKITPQKAKEMMDELPAYILIDARTLEEFKEGHIKGAKLLPHYDISIRADLEIPDKKATYLIYCHSGVRSRMGAQVLLTMGYENIYDFGGITSWPYEITMD